MRNFLIALIVICASSSTAFAQQNQQQFDPAIPKVLYKIAGQEKAKVQKDVVYKRVEQKDLKMDVYSPAEMKAGTPLPAVLFLSGGSESKHWGVFTSYGELTAAHGMVAVQFDKRFPQGEAGLQTALEDINDLINFLRQNAATYNIDKDRIGLWAFLRAAR